MEMNKPDSQEVLHSNSNESQDTIPCSYLSDESKTVEFISPRDFTHGGTSYTQLESNLSEQNSSVCATLGSSADHSYSDFGHSPPHSLVQTVCSTPHEFKRKVDIVTSCKRDGENSSSNPISPKRPKLSQASPSDKPYYLSQEIMLSDAEPSQDTEEILKLTERKSILKAVQKAAVEYVEANSSTSEEDVTVGSQSKLNTERKKKPKEIDKESSKEVPYKQITEGFFVTFTYTVDETRGEIVSIHLKQASKLEVSAEGKPSKLSLSSGSLADTSGSETASVYSGIEKCSIPSKLSLMSVCSSISSTSSSSSATHPVSGTRPKFVMPPAPEIKKLSTYKLPKNCVCQVGCYCPIFALACTTTRLSHSPGVFTPETSSGSSDNVKPEMNEAPTQSQVNAREKEENIVAKKELVESSNVRENVEENPDSTVFPSETYNNLLVFAKWPGNSWFYPGIVENADESRWHTSSHLEVRFIDGNLRRILTTCLFPAHLIPPGSQVMCEKSEVYQPVRIVDLERCNENDMIFYVEVEEKKIVKVPFSRIGLSDTCYKELKKGATSNITPKKTPKFSIGPENVTEGKRSRKLVKWSEDFSYTCTPSGSKSKTSGTPPIKRSASKRKRKYVLTSEESSTDVASVSRRNTRGSSQKKNRKKLKEDEDIKEGGEVEAVKEVKSARQLYSVTPSCSSAKKKILVIIPEKKESSSFTDSQSQTDEGPEFSDIAAPNLDTEFIPDTTVKSLNTKNFKCTSKKKIGDPKEDVRLGPIPETNIFSDYNFVLTHSEVVRPKAVVTKVKTEGSYSEEGSGTDFEDYYVIPTPFDYHRLKEQIIAGGGKCYKNIIDVPTDKHSKTMVITDNVYETPNYLLAVSLGIPILRHDLIIDCCHQNKHISKLLNSGMRMPSGRSMDTGTWVESVSQRKPLAGHLCCITLKNANDSTLKFWKMILQNLGATVFCLKPDDDSGIENQMSFIVGDEGISPELVSDALHLSVPVVSTAWVVQTAIHSKPRPYNQHPHFRYNYCGT